jgi:hypothetical protein
MKLKKQRSPNPVIFKPPRPEKRLAVDLQGPKENETEI